MQIIGFRSATRSNARGALLRIPITLVVAALSWTAAPGPEVLIWLGVAGAMTLIDGMLLRYFNRINHEKLRATAHVYLAYTFLYVVIYNSISVHLWFSGNAFGQAGAVLMVTGSMLHMSHFLFHSRVLLAAGLSPFLLYFFALPLADYLYRGELAALAVGVAGLFCLLHLRAIVLDTVRATDSVHAALREANTERANAEKANSAKSAFLAMISHEIRTPMNAVVAAAELLGGSRLDSAQRQHADMLKNATELLMGLLNDVLDFSKIEAGKMEIETTPFDLHERLRVVASVWVPRAEAKGIDLILDFADDLPRTLVGDPLRLQQIIFNLLSNAVKFTEQGRIRISARSLSQGVVSISVADTGCGVSEDELERIFLSFEQAHLGVARRKGGTGLGLAISRELAVLMGGGLTATSAPGVGSTFTLRLPLPQAQGRPATDATTRRDDTGAILGAQVLAADDNEVNRIVLSAILDQLGCETRLVDDGAAAVAQSDQRKFDVILLDMQMPVMNGLDATRAIRAGDGPNAGTPIIALTANALDGHREEWMAAGANDFLTKPVDSSRLCRAIAQAMRVPEDA